MYTRPRKGGGGSGVSYIDRYLLPYSVLSGGSSPQQAGVKEYSIKEN